ncbi:MAG TPA: deaminase [Candidatus Paceibacterota bacterium]
MQRRILIAYVPVLHEGYRQFFEKYSGAELYIFGPEITSRFRVLGKEIRELSPDLMQKAIEALDIFTSVHVLDAETAGTFNMSDIEIVLPDEDVSRELVTELFPKAQTAFESVFLRWDKHNALAERPVVPKDSVAREEVHKRLMGTAAKEAERSSDIWRHIGAVIAKNGEPILVGHNAHVPSEHTPYVNGDPRSNFHKGEHIELSTALHAEAALIAEAARKGVSLEGTDMYLTVFPCPPCAKLVAYAGIKNLYCDGGYAILDGEQVLKAKGVSIYFVD